MNIQRRTNPVWGLVALGLAAFVVANALGYVPSGLVDLVQRAWPALLVLAGLSFLLRGRLPLGSLIALLATAGLVAGVAFTAYSQRAGQQRTENHQLIAQALPESLSLLRVRVQTLLTDVELLGVPAGGAVNGEFTGSSDNAVEVSFEQLADNSASLMVRETRSSAFPSLETVGRGTMRLELPSNVPLDIELVGDDGDILLNLDGVALERLNVRVTRGDIVTTIPDYAPTLVAANASNGTLQTNSGDLVITIPAAVSARLELNRGGSGIEPLYDANVYNYLVGDVLEARDIVTADKVVRYTLTALNGRIRVETPA